MIKTVRTHLISIFPDTDSASGDTVGSPKRGIWDSSLEQILSHARQN